MRDKMENMKRINIRIPVDVYEYYKDSSKKTGIPMSMLIYMDIKNYRLIEATNENLLRVLKLVGKDLEDSSELPKADER